MQTEFSDTKLDLCICTAGVKKHKPGAGAVGCTWAAPGEQWGLGILHRVTPAQDLSWDLKKDVKQGAKIVTGKPKPLCN